MKVHKKREEISLEKQVKELRELTFKPKINKKSIELDHERA